MEGGLGELGIHCFLHCPTTLGISHNKMHLLFISMYMLGPLSQFATSLRKETVLLILAFSGPSLSARHNVGTGKYLLNCSYMRILDNTIQAVTLKITWEILHDSYILFT